MTSSMTSDQVAYVRYRLSRANETLESARLLLAHGDLHSAVNRIYYACFYVVEALLRTEGLFSRRHSGVMALLDKHWANAGRIPPEMAGFYHEILDKRQAGDYAPFVTFEPQKVAEWLQQAEQFVRCVSELVVRALPEQSQEPQ